MTAKLFGAALANGDQDPTAEKELTPVPVPASIRWRQVPLERTAASRHDQIAVTAYLLSEPRGFTPGREADDWSIAQARVDATVASKFGVSL